MASELPNVTAALVALTEAGIPTDVQELLVRGDASRGIAPGAIIKALNTRPAPAATDTGLVTAKVEHRVHFGEDGNPTEWREGYGMGLYPQEPIVRVEVREYVTRSQAEELLADLHAAIAVKDHGLKLLKADNEAQAARIKELEEYAREATKAITGLTGGGSENFGKPIGELYPADLSFCLERIRDRYVSKAELKRLEAKLAATEKALEPFALISSEGVIKQQTGHVTVITCAEYFHKARAVLGGKP